MGRKGRGKEDAVATVATEKTALEVVQIQGEGTPVLEIDLLYDRSQRNVVVTLESVNGSDSKG